MTLTNAASVRKYDLQERNPLYSEHDYADAPKFATLSKYKRAAISYISGYAVKMAEKQLLCMECCNALGSRSHPATTKFLALKDRGGLFKPTNSVIKVCEESENASIGCWHLQLETFHSVQVQEVLYHILILSTNSV